MRSHGTNSGRPAPALIALVAVALALMVLTSGPVLLFVK